MPATPRSGVPADERALWGAQTALAVENFPISGERMPRDVIHGIVLVKAAAAVVNARHGVLEPQVADAIASACDDLLLHDDWELQFPVDVFQTGSGTSTNMNVNEVLARMASQRLGLPVHPNDHVNAGQSSNDVVPSAIRLAAGTAIATELLPAIDGLRRTLEGRATEHDDTVKLGRTHLMDAAPITFGQELRGWAHMVRFAQRRLDEVVLRLAELPIGGTAVGTGLNTFEGFGAEVATALSRRTGMRWCEATDHFEAQSTIDAFLDASAACRSTALGLHKIAGDLRLMGSGPAGGLGEVTLPALQAGSSIMPGKVNPVIPEVVQQVAAQVVGNDAAIAFSSTASMLQLNTAMPVVARCLMGSIHLLTSTARVLDEKCLQGIEPDRERMQRLAERSASITMVLVPRIGYDAATKVAEVMVDEDLGLRDAMHRVGVESTVDLDLLALAHGRNPN